MKKYSPGATKNSDYYHICDYCELDDGRPVLVWEPLPARIGHFALCYECLRKLDLQYNHPLVLGEPQIIVSRLVISETLRNKVFARDGYKCLKCGSTEDLQLDHIIPFSEGGTTEEENLQTLCKLCNLKKGNKKE